MNDRLEQKLQALYEDNQPDVAFANALEQQLHAMHKGSHSPVQRFSQHTLKRVGIVAASLALLIVVIATVPPLRTLAEELIQFFVLGQGYALPADEPVYQDSVTVSNIAEGEVIAGFEALQWVGDGFHVIHVSAAEGYLHTTYERENERGALMILVQWRADSPLQPTPIDPDAEIIHTTIRGVEAQFVAGAPFGEDAAWRSDHYRQLRWEANGIGYHLRVSAPIAISLEQVLMIAERFE